MQNKWIKAILASFNLVFFSMVVLRFIFNLIPVEAATAPNLGIDEMVSEPVVGYGEIHPTVRVDDCDLSFKQGKKIIQAPRWFKDETWGGEFTCKERQVLSRLAYLESTFRKDVCNSKYKQYCGLFQIGHSARKECVNNNRNNSDYQCALYHFNVNPNRFEAYSRNKYLF